MNMRVVIDGETFTVEVGDLDARPIQVMVEGETFAVWPEGEPTIAQKTHNEPSERSAPVLASPARGSAASAASPAANMVFAPIPGVILSISVQPGVSVTRGQELCVLEAMKMKNSLRASRDGVIRSISVGVGDQVKYHQKLMEYTD